jgi:hypothetical protein
MFRAVAPCLAAALCAAGAGALAQTMYRSTMPDGKVILSDRPMPGARKTEPIQVPAGNVVPGNGGAAAVPGVPRELGGAKPAAPADEGARAQEYTKAEREMRAAQDALDAASAAAAQGQEPREGERTGLAGGGSRLNDDYWARQQQLQDAVSAAQRALDAARDRMNSLR